MRNNISNNEQPSEYTAYTSAKNLNDDNIAAYLLCHIRTTQRDLKQLTITLNENLKPETCKALCAYRKNISYKRYPNVEDMTLEQKLAAFTHNYKGPEVDIGIKASVDIEVIILQSSSYQTVLDNTQNFTNKTPITILQENEQGWVSKLFFDKDNEVTFNRTL